MRLFEFAPSALLDTWHVLSESTENVRFLASGLFDQTYAVKARSVPGLAEKFKDFQAFKTQNPGQPYGSSDHPMISAGPLGREIPKLRHAHLTRDLSVFYTIGGRNPVEVRLYGIFSHADSGTGTPANIKRQKSLARTLSSQTFA